MGDELLPLEQILSDLMRAQTIIMPPHRGSLWIYLLAPVVDWELILLLNAHYRTDLMVELARQVSRNVPTALVLSRADFLGPSTIHLESLGIPRQDLVSLAPFPQSLDVGSLRLSPIAPYSMQPFAPVQWTHLSQHT